MAMAAQPADVTQKPGQEEERANNHTKELEALIYSLREEMGGLRSQLKLSEEASERKSAQME